MKEEPKKLDVKKIEIKVVKHSSHAASKAKAFAAISASGCTDD